MCSDHHNDIPIRTLVTQQGDGWKAHCLDFDLIGLGAEPYDAVDQLEEEIVRHLQAVKTGQASLFHPVAPEVWRQYYDAAEAGLKASGPDAGHIEHRPLVAAV